MVPTDSDVCGCRVQRSFICDHNVVLLADGIQKCEYVHLIYSNRRREERTNRRMIQIFFLKKN